jgi:GT2 family glycosyltransferase
MTNPDMTNPDMTNPDMTTPASENRPSARTAVVVVNYGSSALLRTNLAPLSRALPDLLVVVVDNFSSAVERATLQAIAGAESWTVVAPLTNTGFGTGTNLGVEQARALGATSLILLNPDALLTGEAATALAQAAEERRSALVAPVILRPDGSVWSAGSDLYLDDGRIRARRRRPADADESRITPWLTGACLALSVELWDRVGGFSDEYFLYWEDVDFSTRVLAAGGELVLLDSVTAVHAEGGTQKQGLEKSGQAKSSTYYYFNIRNRLLYAALHSSDSDVMSWQRSAVSVSWEILLQGGRRQFVTPWRPLGAFVRGLRDGRRLVKKHRGGSLPA